MSFLTKLFKKELESVAMEKHELEHRRNVFFSTCGKIRINKTINQLEKVDEFSLEYLTTS